MFQTHKLAKHTPDHLRPYRCSFCPKGFAFKKHLEVHENVHTGNKPYECKYCGMKFASDGNMNGHIRQTHKGIKRNTSKYVGIFTLAFWYHVYLAKKISIVLHMYMVIKNSWPHHLHHSYLHVESENAIFLYSKSSHCAQKCYQERQHNHHGNWHNWGNFDSTMILKTIQKL